MTSQEHRGPTCSNNSLLTHSHNRTGDWRDRTTITYHTQLWQCCWLYTEYHKLFYTLSSPERGQMDLLELTPLSEPFFFLDANNFFFTPDIADDNLQQIGEWVQVKVALQDECQGYGCWRADVFRARVLPFPSRVGWPWCVVQHQEPVNTKTDDYLQN